VHTAKRMQSNGRGACCAVAKTVSMENLDAIVAEVARMEEVSPVCLHLSTLLKKRNELLQKRAALPDSKTLMQDRAAGAEKRKKQAVRGLGLRWVRVRVRPLLPLRVRLSPSPRLASRQRKLSGRRGGGLTNEQRIQLCQRHLQLREKEQVFSIRCPVVGAIAL
jgi:hypothetical protein